MVVFAIPNAVYFEYFANGASWPQSIHADYKTSLVFNSIQRLVQPEPLLFLIFHLIIIWISWC